MLSLRADRGFRFLTGEWFVLFQVALSHLDAFGLHFGLHLVCIYTFISWN